MRIHTTCMLFNYLTNTFEYNENANNFFRYNL